MGINNSLLKSIQTIVDKAINVAPFDKTRQCVVLTNNGDGTYSIKLDGVTYSNVTAHPYNISIDAGSVAKVVIPTNNTNQMYIKSGSPLIDMRAPEIYIDVSDIDSQTGYASTGADKDWYNALVDLGWVSEVIIE